LHEQSDDLVVQLQQKILNLQGRLNEEDNKNFDLEMQNNYLKMELKWMPLF